MFDWVQKLESNTAVCILLVKLCSTTEPKLNRSLHLTQFILLNSKIVCRLGQLYD